jgi:hypothetical protein
VCFEKNALGANLPSNKTIMSKTHKLFYKNKMIPAEWFVGKKNRVHKVEYDGKILYNVLMENYDTIVVNNITCETLHPENQMAKLYRSFKNLNIDDYNKLIAKHNHYHITSAQNDKNSLQKVNMRFK